MAECHVGTRAHRAFVFAGDRDSGYGEAELSSTLGTALNKSGPRKRPLPNSEQPVSRLPCKPSRVTILGKCHVGTSGTSVTSASRGFGLPGIVTLARLVWGDLCYGWRERHWGRRLNKDQQA